MQCFNIHVCRKSSFDVYLIFTSILYPTVKTTCRFIAVLHDTLRALCLLRINNEIEGVKDQGSVHTTWYSTEMGNITVNAESDERAQGRVNRRVEDALLIYSTYL